MTTRIAICGAGALGSMIALHLAAPDLQFFIVDDDRIGEENIATSAYFQHHIGCQKAIVLAEMIYRKSETAGIPFAKTLTRNNRKFLLTPASTNNLIVDAFDNVEARKLTCYQPILNTSVVHVGVSEQRTGSIVWNEWYRVPTGSPRGENPICTHDLGASILRLTAALAANVIDQFLWTGEKRNLMLTEDGRVFT